MLAGFAADRLLGDPRRWHPVAGLGRAAGAAERVFYRDDRSSGAVFVGVCLGAGWAAGEGAARLPGVATRTVATALVTWSVLGGTTLIRVGDAMADALDSGDIDAARLLVPSLCGRDPQALDDAGIVRAALESIAENTSDATVAPLFWAAVAGVPGLILYRVVNTLDAMVGHRSERYRRFGWAAARLDDIANLAPARLTGALVAVLGGAPRRSVQAWRRDAVAHPSPNAGVVEATFAGALGVTLGGRTEYPYGVEQRPLLGDGPAPQTADLRAAVVLSRRVQMATAVGAAAAVFLVSRRSGR
ncbi:cobalamin biosynthesis protein [Gordonia sp. SID5947]|uniref:cobalamin biosynthesis protein n=1 Tax=Gordonia sp. SID5947 TaxID=2690315 RepID=UPI001F02962C|nr:cobalamin biosynthesis protein [Gordonia sp. SID5947]